MVRGETILVNVAKLLLSKLPLYHFQRFNVPFWLIVTFFLFSSSSYVTALDPTTPIPEDPIMGDGSRRDDFPISGNEGFFLFSFDMYEANDSMQLEIDGNKVIDTGFVKGKGIYPFILSSGQTNKTLSVNVNAGEEEPGNDWQYSIHLIPLSLQKFISGFKGSALSIVDNVWDRLTSLFSDPVDTATGAQVIQQNLITLWGAQPLPFTISYNSLLTMNSPFGRGWSHNFQGKLEIMDQENIRIRWNNGRYNTFKLGGVITKKKKNKKNKSADSYEVDKEKEPSARFYRLKANNDNSYT
jgi:hypothetical protein